MSYRQARKGALETVGIAALAAATAVSCTFGAVRMAHNNSRQAASIEAETEKQLSAVISSGSEPATAVVLDADRGRVSTVKLSHPAANAALLAKVALDTAIDGNMTTKQELQIDAATGNDFGQAINAANRANSIGGEKLFLDAGGLGFAALSAGIVIAGLRRGTKEHEYRNEGTLHKWWKLRRA